VEKKGGVDIFVSNAGVNPYFGNILEVSGNLALIEAKLTHLLSFCR